MSWFTFRIASHSLFSLLPSFYAELQNSQIYVAAMDFKPSNEHLSVSVVICVTAFDEPIHVASCRCELILQELSPVSYFSSFLFCLLVELRIYNALFTVFV